MRLPVRSTLLLAVLAAVPAAAQDPTGGAPAEPPEGAEDSRVVVVSDGSFTVATRRDALLGRPTRFRGDVPAEQAGKVLRIERHDRRTGGWVSAASTTVDEDGSFLARWRTDRAGRLRLRAVVEDARARAASASPELSVTVYRRAMSTWYGPGFYGRRTACGQRMTRTLHGVAHRRLPCGTKVALLYKGRTLTVPVVDRGPFRRGVRWDLTAATAKALDFRYTDRVGAVRLREPAPQSARR